MVDLSAPNEWQHICPDTGLVMPWYTKPALDEIVTWDLKDKVVFEYGCGASSLWWARKCKELYGVEYNFEYFCAVYDNVTNGATILHEQNPDSYVQSPRQWQRLFDIIIIDGSFRDACVPVALECLKPGGRLIIDNWLQPSVDWMPSEETKQLLSKYAVQVYPQEGHPDWKTAVWTI